MHCKGMQWLQRCSMSGFHWDSMDSSSFYKSTVDAGEYDEWGNPNDKARLALIMQTCHC